MTRCFLLFFLALLPSHLVAGNPAIDAKRIATASHWETERMDLDITIHAADGFITVDGSMVLQLIDTPSRHLAVLMNSRRREMILEELRVTSSSQSAPSESKVELDLHPAAIEHMSLAMVKFDAELQPGARVELAFSYRSSGQSDQVIIRPDMAYASWVEAWYPLPVDDSDPDDPHTAVKSRAPGRTTFRLPAGWWALSNGSRIQRTVMDTGTVEVWDDTFGTACSFVAGPYLEPAEVRVGDRTVAVYLLSPKTMSARLQAQRLNQAIDVLAERLGPYPYGTFAIAEVPNDVASFGAASEQGFIVARTHFFDPPDGNLPLFSHEAGHTWWGNLVTSTGPGSYLCSESLAQYGAVLAIEAIEGREAALDFLEFSRKSYVHNQSARGYFALVRLGVDRPLSSLDHTTRWDHTLSDSKGHWIYHMLRGAVGDRTFFATLRGLVEQYSDQPLTLDTLRAQFIEAAPDAGLQRFFEQWLDQPGAPVIDLRWVVEKQMKENEHVDHPVESLIINQETYPLDVRVELEQGQAEAPYALDLEVEIEFLDGSRSLHTLHMEDRQLTAVLSVDQLPRALHLDPHRKTLLWRPAYGPRPSSADQIEARGVVTSPHSTAAREGRRDPSHRGDTRRPHPARILAMN